MKIFIAAMALFVITSNVFAQGTAFTYQGRLNDGGSPASGTYNLKFSLFNTNTTGVAIAGPATNNAVSVTNGLFTVLMDFGPGVFTGASNWLEIAVETNGVSTFTTLSSRQQLTPTPYAIFAGNVSIGGLSAGTNGSAVSFSNAANSFNGSFTGNGGGLTNVNAVTLGGLTANQFWKTSGNGGTVAGNNYLGTSDLQPLELKVNGGRALRIEPNSAGAPNIVGGASANAVGAGVVGATIGGGGATNYFGFYSYTNRIDADFGTIAGGIDNHIQTYALWSAIGGGQNNLIQTNSTYSFIGGGLDNVIGTNAVWSVVGGGLGNFIQANSGNSTIPGGYANTIQTSAQSSTIGGGTNNTIQAGASDSTIGGGDNNIIQLNADHSTVSGGYRNAVAGPGGAILGGSANVALGNFDFIGGGQFHTTHGAYNTIGGGYTNQTGGNYATVGGGGANMANGLYSSVGGGVGNVASGQSSVVAGGGTVVLGTFGNHATGDYTSIGGGVFNSATNNYATVAGGGDNTAGGFSATVSGGGGIDSSLNTYPNTARGNWSAIGGGANNAATNDYATVAGGWGNTAGGAAIGATEFLSCIGGTIVVTNPINGDIYPVGSIIPCITTNNEGCTVGGGMLNVASGFTATVCGGQQNVASGFAATVAGGYGNTASGQYSFAAGIGAVATNKGSFVWHDSSSPLFVSTLDDSFNVLAEGGVRLGTSTSLYFGSVARQMINLWGESYGIGVQSYTTYFRCDGTSPGLNGFSWFQGGHHKDGRRDPGADTGGVELMYLNNAGLTVNGVLATVSDRNAKANFAAVDARELLAKVTALPISKWNYKTDPGTRHIGPMAQDFYAAFCVGMDDKHVATVDEGGVALAAIQGLNQKLEEQAKQKDAEIQALKQQNNSLAERLDELETTVKLLAEKK